MRPQVTATDIRRDLVSLLPKLRRFAVTLTGDTAEADELVQNACQRGIARIRQWNNEGRLETWLYTLLRQQWVEESRRHKLKPGASKGNALEQHDSLAHARINPVEATEAHRTVVSLPDGLASVFLLVDVEGHTYKQAADIMGTTPSAIMSQLSSARLQLASKGTNRAPRRY